MTIVGITRVCPFHLTTVRCLLCARHCPRRVDLPSLCRHRSASNTWVMSANVSFTSHFSLLSYSGLQAPPHTTQVPSAWSLGLLQGPKTVGDCGLGCASPWLMRAHAAGRPVGSVMGLQGWITGHCREQHAATASPLPARGLWSKEMAFHSPQEAVLSSITRINRQDDIS